MDFPGLVSQYGYYAVLVGAFLEGETVIALAGLAANRGYLDFRTVVVLAGLAGFAGDQCYFFLGRYQGLRILAKFPEVREKAHRFDEMLARWHAPLIVAIRFLYGFRIVGPILLGMGRCPAWKFVVFNAIGAAIWAPLVVGAGWLFGTAVEAVLKDIHDVEVYLFAAIVALGLGGVLRHRLRKR
jgi:membrane protein DedA with SNARE-associated domain